MRRASRALLAAISLIAVGVTSVATARVLERRDFVRLCVPTSPARAAQSLFVFVLEQTPIWRRDRVAASVCSALRDHGAATALVRIQRSREPVASRAESLALHLGRALPSLPHAERIERLILGGHGPASDVVATLALDGRLLTRAGLDRSNVAGILALGGRCEATPRVDTTLAASQPPVFLVLSGSGDTRATARQCRRFARALDSTGSVRATFLTIPGRDARSIANLSIDDDYTRGVVAFVRGGPVPPGVDRRWTTSREGAAGPVHSTETFAADPALVRDYPTTPRLRGALQFILGNAAHELRSFDLTTYRAIDLTDWLATRPRRDVGDGDHLVVTNVRGERAYFTRAELRRFRPRIVIGLDDEANLFRLLVAYRQRRRFSWVEDSVPLPWLARPVGGLLLFPDSQPKRFPTKVPATSGLTPASFRWQRHDPLGAVRGLPDSLQDVLLGESGCLYCHRFRGAGAESGHMLQENPGVRGGGSALALEAYPSRVLHAFLFDQQRVADLFGVPPLVMPRGRAAALEALVSAERP